MGSIELFDLVAIAVCVVLSAVYSGSETALTALGSRGAKQLLEEAPDRNRAMRLWVERPYEALTAILIGNNLVNITASALVTSVAIEVFGSPYTTYVGGELVRVDSSAVGSAVAVSIGISTFLVLTFGEIIPKIISKAFKGRLALPAMRFVWLSHKLFWPATKVYSWFVHVGVRVVGHELEAEHPVTADDIEFMVNQGTQEGSIDADQSRLLTSAFEYHDMTVKEVMVPRVNVVGVPRDIEFEELLNVLVEAGHSRIPVYKENIDEVAGVFYAKDILRFFQEGGNAKSFDLNNYLREPVFVLESMTVDKLLHGFQESHNHLAIVVDEFGGTAGVVTLEDIIEEFFGEIQDEFDQEEPLLQAEGEVVRIADARIRLDELEHEICIHFPDDQDYESLGGFITDQLGSVPSAGAELSFQDHLFTVLEAEPTHIIRVRIECPEPPEATRANSTGQKLAVQSE